MIKTATAQLDVRRAAPSVNLATARKMAVQSAAIEACEHIPILDNGRPECYS